MWGVGVNLVSGLCVQSWSTNFKLFWFNFSHYGIEKTISKNEPPSKPGCWVTQGKVDFLNPKFNFPIQYSSSFQHWGAWSEAPSLLPQFRVLAERNLGCVLLCCCTQYLTDFKERGFDQCTSFPLRNVLSVYNLAGFSCTFSFISSYSCDPDPAFLWLAAPFDICHKNFHQSMP